MAKLHLLKWKDENGVLRKFYLSREVSSDWRKFGLCLGITHNQMTAWEQERRGSSRDCWNLVMEHWLEHGNELYPTTWEGLQQLLEDIQLKHFAVELKVAVSGAFGVDDKGTYVCTIGNHTVAMAV